MKRLIALLLALVMVCGLIACGNTAAPAQTDAPAADAPAEDAPAADAPAEDAPAEDIPEASSDPIHLKWYLPTNAPQADQETVSNAMEAHILENYGLNLELELVVTDFGSFNDKAQMVIGSGEEYDIMWTSGWLNNYYNNVAKNAFIPLDDLVTDELKEVIPAGLFEACRVNGSLYAIPSYQISASQNVISIPTRLVEEFALDVDSITTLTDLNDFLYAVKEAYPDMYPLAAKSYAPAYGSHPQDEGYEFLIGGTVPGAVMLEGDLTVVNQFEQPVFMEKAKAMYKWMQDGIIRMDSAAVVDLNTDIAAGVHAAWADTSWKPYFEADQEALCGEPVTCIKVSDPWSATGNANATTNAISVHCKHPEVAMQFLTLLNTDAELYNLLCFGIEGTHYTLNADGTATSDDAAGYNPNADWVFACQFNAIPRAGQQADIWDLTREFSNSAKVSPVMGFVFNSEAVSNEIAACTAVFDQYIAPIAAGQVDPETALPEAMEQLKAAGSEKIIAELQTQIDAWAAANGK